MESEYLWAVLLIALVCPIAMFWMMRGHRNSSKDMREDETKPTNTQSASNHPTDGKDAP